MSNAELAAEMRAAAASLTRAAAACDAGDYVSAEISVEDALFRAQSLMARVQEAQRAPTTTSAGYQIGEPKPDTRDRG